MAISQRAFQQTVAGLLLPAVLALTAVVGQESSKTLEWGDHGSINTGRTDSPWSKRIDTIELEAIRIDDRSIMIGEPFVGDIRDLTFRVKNVSDAPVGFIQITLTLPEIKRSPEIPFVRVRTDKRTEKALLPGEEGELRIPDAALSNWVKDAAAAQGRELASINRAAIYSVLVISDKGKQIMGGCLKTLDPRNACLPANSSTSR
ncbi:MAG TPA: hypothetical protein VKD91_19750 [Pyrinomonadaceae bacterium]|nr:hypothetical protein [Pyrinomonadaceae bacterium]